MSIELYDKLEALADNYNIPSITEWRQGRFIDSSKYARMSGEWKDEQDARERTLIRPYGGTNNALFQISGNENIAGIAEYLEAVGRLLKEELSK